MTPIQASIDTALRAGLRCWHLEVRNESQLHRGVPDRETHFRVIAVSPDFEGASRLDRHRRVNALLAEQLAAGLHALAIEAVTPAQWEANGGPALTAPVCQGGAHATPE